MNIPLIEDLHSWAKGLNVYGKDVCVLVGVEACRPFVTIWEDRFPGDLRIRLALEVVDNWLAGPSNDKTDACREQGQIAHRASVMARRQIGNGGNWAAAAFIAEAMSALCKSVSSEDQPEATSSIIAMVLDLLVSATEALGKPK